MDAIVLPMRIARCRWDMMLVALAALCICVDGG